jgi:hypothetical protein
MGEDFTFTKYKECSNEILKLPNNVLLDYDDIKLDNNGTFKILNTYEIQKPEMLPKPSNLLSEWPPNNKMWFYHNYFQTSIPFLTLDDHIAKIDPKNKERVVVLSRLISLKGLLQKFQFEEIDVVKFFLEKCQISALTTNKRIINIDYIKKFFESDTSKLFVEWETKLTKHENKVRLAEKLRLEKLLQKKCNSRNARFRATIDNFNRKFDEDIDVIKTKIKKLEEFII